LGFSSQWLQETDADRTMSTAKNTKKELPQKQRDELLAALKARFEKNMARQQGLVWAKVQARLEAKPDKLWSLAKIQTHFLLTGARCHLSMGAYEQSCTLITTHFSP